jgi:hypothetical protein
MFEFHRVFCATPWEMEPERVRFCGLIGQFNERHAMSHGILYAPVSLTNFRDKRPVQYVVDENIRDARHYILLLQEDWGPVERNFENDYHLALQCADDPALPMREVAVVRKILPSRRPLAAGTPAPDASFSTAEEFDSAITNLLTAWLQPLLYAHAGHTTS